VVGAQVASGSVLEASVATASDSMYPLIISAETAGDARSGEGKFRNVAAAENPSHSSCGLGKRNAGEAEEAGGNPIAAARSRTRGRVAPQSPARTGTGSTATMMMFQ